MEEYVGRPVQSTNQQHSKEITPCSDSSAASTANVVQPVGEQLMPMVMVPAEAYLNEQHTEETSMQVAKTTSTSPVQQPANMNNGLKKESPTKDQTSSSPSYPVAESSVCNGVRIKTETMIDSTSTNTAANTSDCTPDRPGLISDLSDNKPQTKETVVNDSPEPAVIKAETIKIETLTKRCSPTDDDAIRNNPTPKDEELQCASEDIHEREQEASTIQTLTTATEQTPESHPDEDENSCDSVISDEDTTNAVNVSSLFKNVVLVQADSIAAEENDSEGSLKSPTDITTSGDEEDLETNPNATVQSIEDIGREEEPNADEMLHPAGLFIDETEDAQNYEVMDGVEAGQMGRIVALDAPIYDQSEVIDEPDPTNEKNAPHNANDNGMGSSSNAVSTKPSKVMDTVSLSSEEEGSKRRSVEQQISQKCQIRKRNRIANDGKEGLDGDKKKHKMCKDEKSRNSNDDPFGSCTNSSSEDVPNDMYFGASDRVYTVSTKLHWQRQKQKRAKHYSRANDSTDASSDSEEEEWVRRKAKKAEEIARLKLPAYQQQQLQQLVLKKHPKRGRFYDRSQDIPNDIYFGNVNVPLHILHASSSSSDEEQWPGGSVKSVSNSNAGHSKYRQSEHVHTKSNSKSSNYRNYRNSSPRAEMAGNQGSVRSVNRMKEYLKMTGFRHMRYQKLWQGCETNQERAEAILRFLQQQGLQGEPTDEKCRELRKQIQLQKEVEVLDTSVIIGNGEGRVTRQRAKKVSESSTTELGVNTKPELCLASEEQEQAEPTSTETVEPELQCEQPPTEQQQKEQNETVESIPTEQSVEPTIPAGECSNNANAPLNG